MWLNVIQAKLNVRSQLSHQSSYGSCKQWHPGPPDSSTGALDKHHLLVIIIFASLQICCCDFLSSLRLLLLDDRLFRRHRTCRDGGVSTNGVVCICAVLGAWVLVLGRFGGPWSRLHPCSQALRPPSTLEGWVWWLPLTGLSGIHLRIQLILLVAPPFFLGTIPHAYLLLMSLNVAKCNLGYVKHEKILLASSISQGWCVGWPGALMQGQTHQGATSLKTSQVLAPFSQRCITHAQCKRYNLQI